MSAGSPGTPICRIRVSQFRRPWVPIWKRQQRSLGYSSQLSFHPLFQGQAIKGIEVPASAFRNFLFGSLDPVTRSLFHSASCRGWYCNQQPAASSSAAIHQPSAISLHRTLGKIRDTDGYCISPNQSSASPHPRNLDSFLSPIKARQGQNFNRITGLRTSTIHQRPRPWTSTSEYYCWLNAPAQASVLFVCRGNSNQQSTSIWNWTGRLAQSTGIIGVPCHQRSTATHSDN
ncbi:hypothetical protein QBC44DRAFT_308774 [Cladorrhinum sp. PSN332]|nr:hypothetical protein QBC44DRAFT_308774 [Cladorrhinum sp. PSN332]